MIFDQEYIIFEILDVVSLNQKSFFQKEMSDRNFDAISFRFEADTVLKTKNNTFELSDNSICFVPSNVKYKRISKKDDMIVVHFKAFNYNSKDIETFIPENMGKYAELFREIKKCWDGREKAYKNQCSGILNKIFAELYKDNYSVCKNTKIQNSVIYIEKNYLNRDFSLSETAKSSYMSETHFRRLFKAEFGISPKKYVLEKRMNYAKSMILSGYFSVAEIAEACGYNDPKHFSSEFKKFTGVSPSEFKYNYSDT